MIWSRTDAARYGLQHPGDYTGGGPMVVRRDMPGARDCRTILFRIYWKIGRADYGQVSEAEASFFSRPTKLIRPQSSSVHTRKKTAAHQMGISTNTVSFHLKNIYSKLQVHSKTEAVSKALRERLL
jgi:hypothetical protein